MGFESELDRRNQADQILPASAERPKNIGIIEHERGENGQMVMVTTRWGVKREVKVLEEEAVARGEEIYPSGFSHVWQSSSNLSMAQREEQELTAFAESLRLVTDTPPAILAIGSGSPLFEDYAGEMARRMKWPGTETRNYYLACNSQVEALREVLTDPRFQPGGELEDQEVIVGGWEGLTRLVDYTRRDSTDPFSPRVFGNSGALMKFVPGRDFVPVADVFFCEEDKNGYLAAVMTYTMDPDGPLVQIAGNTKKIKMPVPEPGVSVWILLKPTAKMFIRAFEKGVDMLKGKYDAGLADGSIVEKPISLVTGHHPSTGPFLVTQKILKRIWGIDEQRYAWVVNDGNSSGATAPKALNRHLGLGQPGEQIKIIQPGERMILIGYGGGINFTGIVMDRG